MVQQINYVALHITNDCSHRCGMCYATPEGQVKCHGDIDTLKAIAIELKNANVKDVLLVGGDPCEYPRMLELLEYLNTLGLRVMIESNTHIYKNATLEQVVPLIYQFDTTIHGPTKDIHDNFAGVTGAYETLLGQLLRIQELKYKEIQEICVTYNVMPHNYDRLYESTVRLLDRGINLAGISVQRISPYGKAQGSSKFAMPIEQIIIAMDNISRINTDLGIPTNMVDSFPYCLIPRKYHQYLSKCDWGYTTAAIDMNGNLSRCALSSNYSLGNILQEDLTGIWNNHPQLLEFRRKKYLDQKCQECDTLELCGGGCAMSCGNDMLCSDSLVKRLRK